MARVFGWSLLSGFLSGLMAIVGLLALGMLAGLALKRELAGPTKSPKSVAKATAAAVLGSTVYKAGTLELTGPLRFGVGAVVVAIQVLLMLRFTRCA
jgi:hypothetical protein